MLSAGGTGSFPRKLSADEEQRYLVALAGGDKHARSMLIEHNLRLVAHIVKKFYISPADADDMLSIGTIGLIKAVDTYRADRKVRFSSYASRCIENECLMYLRSQKKTAQDISISEPVETDKNGNELTLMDVIASQDVLADRLDERIGCEQLMKLIGAEENSRELEIIKLRYGLNDGRPLTQKQVAERLGISRSYVSRIEKKALEGWRARLNG